MFFARRGPRAVAGVALVVAVLLISGCGASGSSAPHGPRSVNVVIHSANGTVRRVVRARSNSGNGLTLDVKLPSDPSAGVPPQAASAGTATAQAAAVRRRLRGVTLWLPYWNIQTAARDALDHAGTVTVAQPFWFEVHGTSTVVDQSDGAGPSLIAQLHARGLTVIPTVTESDGMHAFAKLLARPGKLRKMARALTSIGERPGVNGVDLDFENLAIRDGSTSDAEKVRDGYPRLLARVCRAMHAHGRICEVTVMSQNGPQALAAEATANGVYDYHALGAVADRVQVMAYDEHTPSGSAGAIAPMPWVRSVISWATTQIPAVKLALGVPAYGYDWSSTGHGTTVTAVDAPAAAAAVHARVRWSASQAEAWFRYRGAKVGHGKHRHRLRHVVWFENARANYARAVLAARSGLSGISLWAAGYEQPGLWRMLKRLR